MFPSHGSTALGKPNKSYKLVIFLFSACMILVSTSVCSDSRKQSERVKRTHHFNKESTDRLNATNAFHGHSEKPEKRGAVMKVSIQFFLFFG